MWFIISHHAHLFTFLNLNKYWTCGDGKQGTGGDGLWSARFNETPSRNEQDTVNSIIFHKKGSKTYRSLFPHVCFRFSQLWAQATEMWEEQPAKCCNLCRERRVPGGTGLHTARWRGVALGRAGKELFCTALPVCGVLPSLSLQSLPNSSCYFIQSLSWLVYKMKVLEHKHNFLGQLY